MRDGTAEPVSRDQILRHARGQGNVHFPYSADHEQDWQPYPVDPYSTTIRDDHKYCRLLDPEDRELTHTGNQQRTSEVLDGRGTVACCGRHKSHHTWCGMKCCCFLTRLFAATLSERRPSNVNVDLKVTGWRFLCSAYRWCFCDVIILGGGVSIRRIQA